MNPNYFFIFITIFGTVLGQLIMKYGSKTFTPILPTSIKNAFLLLFQVLTNIYFLSSLLLAFIAAISWIFVLKKFDLSHAYPFTALTLVLVIVASSLIFKEDLGIYKITGSGLIIGGILLLAKG